MKRLILVRYGNYVGSSLTDSGRKQIRNLIPALVESVVGNILLVCSPVQRAKESATILAEHFKIPIIENPVWKAEGDWSDDVGAFASIADIDPSVDTLVVVTHMPFMYSFPPYYGIKALGVPLHYGAVEKGEAQVIDCEKKTMIRLKPALTTDEPLPAQHVRPISGRNGNYTREHADRYGSKLKELSPKRRLKKVYLFGSVAKHGSGKDLDLVFEVPLPVFLDFAKRCVGALDGFHPVSAGLLPMYSSFWNYYSPKVKRVEYAYETVGLSDSDIAELESIVPKKKMDVLCLPVGWRDKTDVNKVLHTAFGFGKDPNLLQHIVDSATELN